MEQQQKNIILQGDKILGILLKFVSFLVVIVFIGNVIFNIFYFKQLGAFWLPLLSLEDYYEGHIVAIWMAISVFMTSSLCFMFYNDLIKKFTYLNSNKSLPWLKKLNIWALILVIALIVLFLLIFSYQFGFLPFIILIGAFLWTQKNHKFKLATSMLVLYWVTMALLGLEHATKPITTNVYLQANIAGSNFHVVRCINKGCIVNTKKDLRFYKWEDINFLQQRKFIISENSNESK